MEKPRFKIRQDKNYTHNIRFYDVRDVKNNGCGYIINIMDSHSHGHVVEFRDETRNTGLSTSQKTIESDEDDYLPF